jgi:hypothetical protein
MAWEAGTKNSSRVKMMKARWAAPMVKLVEAALRLVYLTVCCSVIFFETYESFYKRYYSVVIETFHLIIILLLYV